LWRPWLRYPLTDAGPKTTILAANLVFQFVVADAGRIEG